eukprot:ctg_5522.g636
MAARGSATASVVAGGRLRGDGRDDGGPDAGAH